MCAHCSASPVFNSPLLSISSLTNNAALPDADLGDPTSSLETSFSSSQDASTFVLDYSVPQARVSESICSSNTLLTEAPLCSSQAELEASVPTVIYLVDTESEPVELDSTESEEEACMSILLSQPDVLTDLPAHSQEELQDFGTLIPIALYMARLPSAPMNPGAHVTVEHSYTVGCPLVWKKRAEVLNEAFEKVSKELRASKKRESRLRSRITSFLKTRVRGRRVKLGLPNHLAQPVEVFEVQVINDAVELCNPVTS